MVWCTKFDQDTEMSGSCNVPDGQAKSQTTDTHLDQLSALDINSKPSKFRRSGIICTIGPASRDPDVLVKMMETGMNIARLKFFNESHEYYEETIRNIRMAVEKYSNQLGILYPLAIALDTKGPEMRSGLLEGGVTAEVELKTGELVKLTTDSSMQDKGNKHMIYVDYENITKIVKPGCRIGVDNGLISLIVIDLIGNIINCKIENGGFLGSKRYINLPGMSVDLPAVSEKDKHDIKFGIEQKVDMIFASFIRNAKGVTEIRHLLGTEAKKILVISKVENQQGMHNIDEIIQASDGILVARGCLGTEMPIEKLFIAQKAIISKCNKIGKPVICATQMLESMINKPRPTNAENTDVANAILDGADCLMLTAETATGQYPLECILTMAKTCKEAESTIWHWRQFSNLVRQIIPPIDCANGIAIAAVCSAYHCAATAIIVVTCTGRSAYLISKNRPNCLIVAISRKSQTLRQLNLYRGVLPLFYPETRVTNWSEDVDLRVEYAIVFGKDRGFITSHSNVVIVTGWKQGSGYTNSLRIRVIE